MRFFFLNVISLCLLSTVSAQSFLERSSEFGFDKDGHSSGMTIGDVNGDGLEDIFVTRRIGSNLLYLNKGNFVFEEVAEAWGVSDFGNKSSLLFDYDNDDDLDLFVGSQINKSDLYRNEGAAFVEVTDEMNVNIDVPLRSAHAVDYDNDGDLDLYITATLENNILLRNDGSRFTDVTAVSGIFDDQHSMGAIFFDYDNDGDQDLYQTRDFADGNLFFKNEGGTFVDATVETQTGYKGDGMGVDVTDINGDGLLDIYFSNLYENVLYVQNGQGSFDEVDNPILKDWGMGWGMFLFDARNSGNKDIYIANDSHFMVNGENHSNKLILNNGGFDFIAPPMDEKVNNMHASYGAAYADFDLDGRLDFCIANRGDATNQIFQNTSTLKNYLSIKLVGTVSNRQAVGAKVILTAGGKTQTDILTCGSGYGSQSTSKLHFGLAELTEVENIKVQWPSGQETVLENIAANQTLTIEESAGVVPQGPVVWTEPSFPTQKDDIILYFDAAEGNGALAGFSGTVYAHAGVITSASTAPNDWKHVQGNWGTADDRVRMTSEGNDIHSLSYNIEDYYMISPGEVVEQLAFVFRNSDGSIVGRAETGEDIFLDVYPPDEGLLANLIAPQNENNIIYLGDELLIDLQLNKEATIQLWDNGELRSTTTTDRLTTTLLGSELGTHTVELSISDGVETTTVFVYYFVLDSNESLEDPASEIVDGLNYKTGSSYVFQLTAPGKQHVFLLCPENNYEIDLNYQLTKSRDENKFWIELPATLFENGKNNYQYLVDGVIKIADPYSEVVLDPWNDSGVPADVLAELPAYPESMTMGIVTAFDLEKTDYAWTVTDFEKPAKTDLVIYEILMRDFLSDKNYKSLLDTLDYLETLGINAIELMPIYEFEGNQSWGYNPSFHLAVDKYYGSRDQLRAVIDACHERGIAVILDVVFNHAFSQSPLCQLYWNASAFRPAADNPWLNETPKHPFNVGYDFNHESAYTKAWVKRNLEHWVEEYKFDGFRFDLSKGLTQTFSGSNGSLMSRYDQSRIDILKDYADHIWSLDDEAYVIMEHFADNAEEKVLANYGMMLWGNMTHEFGEAAMGYSSDLEWADYTVRDWNDPNLIAYMESHDEERMGYKLANFGDSEGFYNTRELEIAAKRVAAASAIYFSIPGPKMLWQFGELAYDFSINRCTNGSVNSNCRLDPKPIRWDYFEEENRSGLYDKIAAMTHLKTSYPTFATRDFDFNDSNFFVKSVHLSHPEMDAVTLANFRVIDSQIIPKFPYTGTWYEYFSGNILEVTDTEERLPFTPGEYRIYTSQQLEPPGGYFTATTELDQASYTVSPNPIQSSEILTIELGTRTIDAKVQLTDLTGQSVQIKTERQGATLTMPMHNLTSGTYFLTVRSEAAIHTQKIIVIE